MTAKKNLIFFIFVFGLLSSASLLLSQYEPGSNGIQDYQNQTQVEKTSNNLPDWLEPAPTTLWVKINGFGITSMLIIILAFILGFVNIFIGMNAGGRQNFKLIRRCVVYTVAIAIFSKPIFNLIHVYLANGLSLLPFIPAEIATGIVGIIVYTAWVTYLIFSGILLYESFIVTAKEAHPM